MATNPVMWFEIHVEDMPRARMFHESVLGVPLAPLDSGAIEMLAFPSDMTVHGASGALVRMPGIASGGNSTLVYFGCTDCAVEAARITDAGGRVERDKMSIGQYGFIALGVDNEGNRFGLHSLA